jgi:hypothetical protein
MGIFRELWALISFLVTAPFMNYEKDMDFFEWIMFLFSVVFLISTYWFFPAIIIAGIVEAITSLL